jgi:hypothetical protein
MNALPKSLSFQDLSKAQQRLLPTGFNMSNIASDWQSLARLFQKRHLIAHRLGVVDKKYILKTGDTSTIAGKRVVISGDEIILGSKDCDKLANEFFGAFLS